MFVFYTGKENYSGVSATIVIISLMMSGLHLATYQSLHDRIRVSGVLMIFAYDTAVNTVYSYNLHSLNGKIQKHFSC